MFGFKRKFKNKVSKDKLNRQKNEYEAAAKALSSRFNLDESQISKAYESNPGQLKAIFKKASSIASYQMLSLGIGLLSIAGMGAIRRPIIHLLALSAVAGAGYVFNKERMHRLQNNVRKQLEDYSHSGKDRTPKP